MNLSVLNVTIFGAGILLIYAALRDVDPRTVVQNALKGKATPGTAKPPVTPPVDPTKPTVPSKPGKPGVNTASWSSV